jgi:hypothetical protein
MVIKMKKNLRVVKTSIILGMLLFSMFVIIGPVISADEIATDANSGGLFSFNHIVRVEWPGQKNETLAIKPYIDTTAYTLNIYHSLTRGALGTGLYSVLYAGRTVKMTVTIKSYPSDWSKVTSFTNTIDVKLPDSINDPAVVPYPYSLSITLNDKAPAFEIGPIVLGITIDAYGIIDAYDQDLTVNIKPDYAPKLNVLAETQNKVIGPMDTTSIPIKVTNLGNGESKIYFNVPDIPSGWTVLVTDQVTLAPDQTETVYMTVKPPKGFGYHDDAYTFKVEYYPAWSTDPSKIGPTEQVTVSIESRGISFIGGEIVLPIIILLIVVIFIIYYFIKKSKQK